MTIIKEIKSGNSSESFNEGDIVIHQEFGKGKIEKIMGSGENAKAIVKFEAVGLKKLMIKYAKLKKVVKEEPEAEKEPQQENRNEQDK